MITDNVAFRHTFESLSQPNPHLDKSFVAKLDSARLLACLLRTIAFTDIVLMKVTEDSIRFAVQRAKTIQAHVSVTKSHFRELSVVAESDDKEEANGESVSVSVEIKTLLECLDLFGHASGFLVSPSTGNENGPSGAATDGNARTRQKQHITLQNQHATAMMMEYKDNQLEIILEDEGIIAACQLATFDDVENFVDFGFSSAVCCVKIIIPSSWLADALTRVSSADSVITFEVSPTNRQSPLIIKTQSDSESVQVAFSNESDLLEFFHCSKPLVQFSYKFSNTCIDQALALSTKTSLRINELGLLSIQLMVPLNTREQYAFVEYLILPLVDS